MQTFPELKTYLLGRSPKEKHSYWRGLSFRRLRSLLLAVFFTFSTIGLMTSIRAAGKTPLVIALGWAFITGATSLGYVLVFARKPIYFPAVVLGQWTITSLYSGLAKKVDAANWLRPLPESEALAVFTTIAIIFMALGYTFFLAFIEREGKQIIRAQAELAAAHGIQKTLVPPIERRLSGCEVYGISVPSEKVGGDVVDVVPLTDGGAMAYVADVAGHGLQAGILMGMLKTAVRTQLLASPEPASLFASLNQVMPEVKESHMYATCAALRLGPQDADGALPVEFAVAGHPAILRISGSTGQAEHFTDEQLPLGLFSFAEYRSLRFCCQSGDLLAVTSDGVLEVEAEDGAQFGSARFETLLRDGRRQDLGPLAAQILDAAKAYGKQTDDQTLLLVRVL
jgi:hypothetical protein